MEVSRHNGHMTSFRWTLRSSRSLQPLLAYLNLLRGCKCLIVDVSDTRCSSGFDSKPMPAVPGDTHSEVVRRRCSNTQSCNKAKTDMDLERGGRLHTWTWACPRNPILSVMELAAAFPKVEFLVDMLIDPTPDEPKEITPSLRTSGTCMYMHLYANLRGCVQENKGCAYTA